MGKWTQSKIKHTWNPSTVLQKWLFSHVNIHSQANIVQWHGPADSAQAKIGPVEDGSAGAKVALFPTGCVQVEHWPAEPNMAKGAGIGKKHVVLNFFFKASSELTNYVIRHISKYSNTMISLPAPCKPHKPISPVPVQAQWKLVLSWSEWIWADLCGTVISWDFTAQIWVFVP